jgi:RNA polymerase sigma-70 factor (ECF subfamily)
MEADDSPLPDKEGHSPGDDALVRRAQSGELSAFDELVRRHLPRAALIARSMLRNTMDAEDVLQDSFFRAFQHLGKLDLARGGFGPWLSAIVTRLSLNAIASRRSRKVFSLDTAPDTPSALPSPSPLPDELAARNHFRDGFRRALDSLSPRQRAIVTLYEVEGMSSADIADYLEVDTATVRWHLHKARGILRETLEKFREGDRP